MNHGTTEQNATRTTPFLEQLFLVSVTLLPEEHPVLAEGRQRRWVWGLGAQFPAPAQILGGPGCTCASPSVDSEGTALQGDVLPNSIALHCAKIWQYCSWIISDLFCVIFWWDSFLLETEDERMAAASWLGHLKVFLLIFRKKASPTGRKKVTVKKSFSCFFPH